MEEAYIPEALQYGLMPETFYGHIKQWTRWVSYWNILESFTTACANFRPGKNIGNCQVALRMRLFIPKSRTRKLNFKMRFMGFTYGLMVFSPIIGITNMILMPTFLFTRLNLMYFQDVSQMRLLLRIKCLMIQATCVHDIHLSIITGYQLCIPEGCNSI